MAGKKTLISLVAAAALSFFVQSCGSTSTTDNKGEIKVGASLALKADETQKTLEATVNMTPERVVIDKVNFTCQNENETQQETILLPVETYNYDANTKIKYNPVGSTTATKICPLAPGKNYVLAEITTFSQGITDFVSASYFFNSPTAPVNEDESPAGITKSINTSLNLKALPESKQLLVDMDFTSPGTLIMKYSLELSAIGCSIHDQGDITLSMYGNGLLSNPREVLVEKKYNCLGQGNNHVKVTAFSPEGITSFAVADYFYGSQEILKNIDIDVDSSFMPETNQIKLYMTGTVMNTAISRYVLELLTNICSVQDTLPLTYLTDEDGLYYNPDGKTSAEKTYSCLAEGDNKVKVTAFSPEGITAVVEKTYGYNPAVPSGSPPTASISFSEILGLEQKVNLSITATDPDSDIKLVYLDVYNSETQSSARTTLLSNTLLGSFSTQTFAFYGKGKNTYILTVADSKSHTVQQSISAVCDNATDSDAITVITNELNSRGFVVTYNYTTVLQNQIQIIADVYGKNDPKFCEVAIDYKPDEDAQVFAENKDMPYTLTIPLGTEYEVYTTLTGFLDKNCPD